MSRHKRVVVWVVVKDYGTWNSIRAEPSLSKKEALESHPLAGDQYPVVKLVEHDPSADAVVRAAMRWYWDGRQLKALSDTIERYYERRRKR